MDCIKFLKVYTYIGYRTYFCNSRLQQQYSICQVRHNSNKKIAVNTKRWEKRKQIDDMLQNEVLYGRSVCKIALSVSRRSIFRLYLLKMWENFEPDDKRIMDVCKSANDRGIPITFSNRQYLDHLSLGRPHQGVCLEVGELPYINLDENCINSKDFMTENQPLTKKTLPLWVLLHGILDPMNLGSILRSSYFLGVNKVIMHGNCAPLTPTVSKASSGASEILPNYRVYEIEHLIEELKRNDWDVIGTVASDDDDDTPHTKDCNDSCLVDLSQISISKPSLVIFGSEGHGIPRYIQDGCTKRVAIKSDSFFENSTDDAQSLQGLIGSLNVSSAAGIILYELKRQQSLVIK